MKQKHKTLSLLEYKIFTGKLTDIDYRKKQLITTINQYSYCIADNDLQFKKALQKSDILLPDGIGIVVAAKLLRKQKIQKIAGAEIHQYLLEQVNKDHGTCMYMGASESTLLKIKERLSQEYPNIRVATYSPPYKPEFSKEDNQAMIAAVNGFKPYVLFVGMTAPKQEKWAKAHKDQLDVGTICAIGAVFDFYAGTVERPSPFWVNLGLEWFIRLLKEPKRMWRRYVYYGPFFGYVLLKMGLRIRKQRRTIYKEKQQNTTH
ncbi:WecB/TagA/CpsF family glycosyltransferase [Wenyingzhuangia sp. 2_MG-2023]|uniref:WecB/TagA/CpsF family glycosyltransferase n=1 Tax=Wenyingzhuangia sp. 2_MG-2023 TaxID=3062639 RepID=UPI0026E3FB1B|nr:WecB/TagA/CpsF family glycosyltransferase [Wenyingzhuangia sp. 2_MG-2023]MDO6739086.1 WecB/TagA/CpsF family glycosyltransferase [Wenyingzhuangia sp. 2_MG-2023]